ncbi:MAG TPA: hypothetical protein VG222_14605, partial [Vicinamibacterales bacterium]|nr:hypothetical protein [Vicinamibacterales bacterium]
MLHTPTVSRSLLIAVATTMAASAPVVAQDEGALRAFFEGRRVTVKIDMPGSSDGVDVRADSKQPVDYQRYGDRLEQYGAAIHAGESTTVTLVKVKKDLIEFQLGGGGFGTFGDDTSTSVNMPLAEKSQREKDLEKRVKEEDDAHRRRELEHDLAGLRDARERENRRIEAARTVAEARKREQVAEQRLRGGSRFNVRYDGAVPKDLRPADLAAALGPFVDMSGETAAQREAAGPPADPFVAGENVPRKGMLRQDAERDLGRPTDASERREGALTVVTLVFVRPGQRITAEFVD